MNKRRPGPATASANGFTARGRGRAENPDPGTELISADLTWGDQPAVLTQAAALAARVLGADYSEVLQLGKDGESFAVRAGVGWEEGVVGSRRTATGAGTLAARTLQSDGPVKVRDFARDKRIRRDEILREHGIVSGLSVIIRGPEQPIGVLLVYTNVKREFSECDAASLEAVASLLSTSLTRAVRPVDPQIYADIVMNADTGFSVWNFPDTADPDSMSPVASNPVMDDCMSAIDNAEIARACAEVVRDGQPKDLGEVRCEDERDAERVLSVKAFPLPNDCVGIACIDITERVVAEATIRHMAFHDALTGLPNRDLCVDRLTIALAQSRRTQEMLAVGFLDVDRFKVINDTYGHSTGDAVLLSVAGNLASLLRESDTIARVGGDEFVLLLTGLHRVEDVMEIGERILGTLRASPVLEEHDFRATASIGFAIWPADGEDPETLIKNADTAMYRAKDEGRDAYQLYTPAMNEQAANRVSIESDLRGALARGELETHYQPQVTIAGRSIVGSEALVRWRHPVRGLVSPAEFIPIAEETGLILPLGQWVLEQACRQAVSWREAGLHPAEVAVNLSARQFRQRNLVEIVAGVLEETGLEPERLHLEITEGLAMRDPDLTVRILAGLKEMGVRIAIDDFGTGYSSLAYLKRFPIDILKLDRSLISDVVADRGSAAIASAVVTMSRGLGLSTIAEGVETEGQLSLLSDLECEVFQGFLFSKALPPSDFATMLRKTAHVVEAKR